jgi:hypothetical protein
MIRHPRVIPALENLDTALSIYSISNFEIAKLILLKILPTIETLSRVARKGYLAYIKLLLNECRMVLTNEQVDTVINMVWARRDFPYLKGSILEISISDREFKMEVINLLRKYNKQGNDSVRCKISRLL